MKKPERRDIETCCCDNWQGGCGCSVEDYNDCLKEWHIFLPSKKEIKELIAFERGYCEAHSYTQEEELDRIRSETIRRYL